ncbi:MAG: carbon-nitrogen hydrolase family protein [Anaerolineae bacterium]
MKAALIVPCLSSDSAANLVKLLALADQVAAEGARLILLPEAALTGLINNDDPAHDLPLGQVIPGPVTAVFARLCRERNVWLGLGLLERAGFCLYDSALLFNPGGKIVLHYRRIQPQWHGKEADQAVYRQGSKVMAVETPFGRLVFLVCGDLFDDAILARLHAARPDLLLFPFARCLPGGLIDQQRWDSEELPAYLERIRLAQIAALMVNYLADGSLAGDGSCGGAWAVAADGEVLASLPLGREGTMQVEL